MSAEQKTTNPSLRGAASNYTHCDDSPFQQTVPAVKLPVEPLLQIFDLEQNNANRIRQERDMLAEAIFKMGIELGHISPDAVITGPHLLLICDDIVRLHKEQ